MNDLFSVQHPPVVVDSVDGRLVKAPSISALADGGWIIVWTSYVHGSLRSDDIYQQRFSATGEAITEPAIVNQFTDQKQIAPDVAGLPDGGWVTTWSSYTQDGSAYGVYQQVYDADGNPSGGETLVNTFTESTQSQSSITVLEDGGWVVTWESFKQTGNSTEIYQQQFSSDGTPVGSEELVSTIGSSSHQATITPLSNGGWITVWMAHGIDGSFGAIIQQVFAADGTTIGGQTQVNTFTHDVQSAPQITTLASGGWVIVWQSYEQDFGFTAGIYQQVYAADGTMVGEETLVNTRVSGSQKEPDIIALDDGGWMVIWHSETNTGGESYIAAQRYDANGNALGNEVALVDSYSSRVSTPEATLLEDGSVAITWREWGEDTSSYQLLVTVYDVVPATLDTIDPVQTGTNGEDVITAHDTIATSLFGEQGNDVLTGGSSDDIIDGGEGRDRLNGGGGENILTGGVGVDTFIFNTETGSNLITDFEVGVDRLDFSEFSESSGTVLFEVGQLPAERASCFFDPSVVNIYVSFIRNGTNVDIYVSTDGGVSTNTPVGTLEDIRILDLDINDFIL